MSTCLCKEWRLGARADFSPGLVEQERAAEAPLLCRNFRLCKKDPGGKRGLSPRGGGRGGENQVLEFECPSVMR